MSARLRLYLIASGVLALLAGTTAFLQCRDQKIVTQSVQAADQHDVQGQVHEAQGVQHDQKSEAITPELKALRAEVARLRANSAALLAMGTSSNPLVPVVETQNRVIQAQDTQAQELTAARDEHQAAEQSYRAEAANLRTALAHTPALHPLAAGLLYGTQGTKGVWAEYDLGRVRVGVDLQLRQLPLVDQTNFEAVARLGWRF